MRNLLIYGTAQDFTPLLPNARAAVLGAAGSLTHHCRVIVSDRHGLDAEVARTCALWGIPFTVYGTAARPRNGVSLRHYQRLHICPLRTSLDNLLNRHLMQLAHTVVVIGDSPDCKAMQLWARLCGKPPPLTFAEKERVHTALYERVRATARTTPTLDIPIVPRVIMPLDPQTAAQKFLTVQ